MYQYYLNASNIKSSETIFNTKYKNGALQVAPDGKIYIAKDQAYPGNNENSCKHLDVIHEPNKTGVACNYEADYVYLNGRLSELGLPTFIQSSFENCNYQLGRQEYNCDELAGDPPAFFVPLIAKETVNPGIIGMDFCIEFDTNYVNPTGNVNIGNVVTRGSEDVSYYINHNDYTGKVYVSIFYESIDEDAQFIGSGEIASVEFELTSNYEKEQTIYFTSCELIESYQLEVKNACVDFGSTKIIDDNILDGRLIYWADTNRPIGYDKYNPADYLPTFINGADSNCTINNYAASVPNINGEFKYDINNGDWINIERDISASEDVAPVINGFDCYLTGKVTTLSSEFMPSIYQIVAMDVNYNGTVEAGDITHIQNRFLKVTDEFPQTWNYPSANKASKDWLFIDDLILSEPIYTISDNYPFIDGNGYCKYNVPNIPFCQETYSYSHGICNVTSDGLYHGVLLGDVDGSWNSTESNNNLKSNGSQVIFNLTESIVDDEGIINIPVYCIDKDIYSLDLIVESYDKSTLEPKGFELTNVTSDNMIVAFNDRIRFTSYSTKSYGINSSQPLYIIKFQTDNDSIVEEQLGEITAYLNGKEVNVNILKNTSESNNMEVNPDEDIISVYPNPTPGIINISAEKALENATITVSDLTGKVIYNKYYANTQKASINLTGHPEGMYIIRVTNEQGSVYKKIILN